METGAAGRCEDRLPRLGDYLGEPQRSRVLRPDLDVDAMVAVTAEMIERGLETGAGSPDPEAATRLLSVHLGGGPRSTVTR